jgi:curved DNA-binding protein
MVIKAKGHGQGFDFEFGGTGFSDFFEQLFGHTGSHRGGFSGFRNHEGQESSERGRDVEGDIMVTLDEAAHGSVRTVTVRHGSKNESHQVKIPAGVTEGQRLRIAGRGEHGSGGGQSGDLYLRVRLARHPDFEVDGHNLIYEAELAPWESVLGAEITVPTLDGHVHIKIPAGTQSGQKLRVRDHGLGKKGDLYVVAKIVVPSKISDGEKKLWEQLKSDSKFNPRG